MTSIMVQEKSQIKGSLMFTSPGPKYKLPTLLGDKGHDTTSSFLKYPSYSFGVVHGKSKSTFGPGPCYFINSNVLRNGQQEGYQFSLGRRTKEIKSWATPGPGAPPSEKTNAAIYSSNLAYSFGTRHQPSRSNKVPGPNCYKLSRITAQSAKKEAPSFTIKGPLDLNKIGANTRRTPGPARYSMLDTSIYKDRAPQFTMKSRSYMPGSISKNPGPGAYSVCKAYTERTNPAYSFGVRHSDRMTPLVVDIPAIECAACS